MKKRFEEIKDGDFFIYYRILYRKDWSGMASPLTGQNYSNRYFWGDSKVIPVIVTIKVKEK